MNWIKSHRFYILTAACGLAAGALLSLGLMIALLPSMMIVTSECAGGYVETVAALEQNIRDKGWQVSQVWDINESLVKHDVEMTPQVTLLKLCKPDYAADVLETDTPIACMMPCTFAVWESGDGGVYLSRMNLSLMGRLFGGNIAEIMGSKVARDEHEMLEGLLK